MNEDIRSPDSRSMVLLLASIAVALVVVHLIAMQLNFNPEIGLKQYLGFHYWHLAIFDLDEEESFGTWFSAVILLYAGRLLLSIASQERIDGQLWHAWWWLLAIGFHLLSIDEVVGIHEYLNTVFKPEDWTSTGFVIVFFIALAYMPFLWSYRWRLSRMFLIAGLVYVGGVIGVERWSGEDVNSLSYNMITALEEGMEMAGVIIFIHALLDYRSRGLAER